MQTNNQRGFIACLHLSLDIPTSQHLTIRETRTKLKSLAKRRLRNRIPCSAEEAHKSILLRQSQGKHCGDEPDGLLKDAGHVQRSLKGMERFSVHQFHMRPINEQRRLAERRYCPPSRTFG